MFSAFGRVRADVADFGPHGRRLAAAVRVGPPPAQKTGEWAEKKKAVM